MDQRKKQRGQSLIEYLIIVALVAIGAIGIMRVVGQTVSVKFAQISKSLGADIEGDISPPKVTETLYQKKDLRDFMSGSQTRDNNR